MTGAAAGSDHLRQLSHSGKSKQLEIGGALEIGGPDDHKARFGIRPFPLAAVFNIDGQGNFKDGPVWLIRKRPKASAMRNNDRLTDRKSDSHSGRLGRKEWFEDLLLILLVDSRAGVFDRNADFRDAFGKIRRNPQPMF